MFYLGDTMIRKKSDPIERSMELALKPGSFIDYGGSWGFVNGLEKVKEEIDSLIKTEPNRAVQLLETFIAGCYEKAEEIDGSDGSFGMFVESLFCTWIKARQGAKSDPHETVKQLLSWMDNDNYGFCYRIERNAVKAFDKAGLRAFAEIARNEFTTELDQEKKRESTEKNALNSPRLRRLSNVLRSIYAEQRDADQYLAIAEEMGLTPHDCEVIAKILQTRRKPQEALAWVERGLVLKEDNRFCGDGSSYSLPELKRHLLKSLGKETDALDSAWNEFKEHSSKDSYKILMKYVPKATRPDWYQKVLEIAKEADLSAAIELYVELKEWDKLAELIGKTKPAALEDLSHYTTEPAAKKLENLHPDAAAKLYQALGLRILNAKKSKYYDAALDNFERGRKCFKKAGLENEWESLVCTIRKDHSRKTGFMSAFEALAIQGTVPRQPSFLDRAKQRRAQYFSKN